MQLRSGRQIKSGSPEPERIYDYIVRRNHIINQMKIILFQITQTDNLENRVSMIQTVFSTFNREYTFLTKHKFEPNKRFIQSIHEKSIEFINLLKNGHDKNPIYKMLYKVHDKTHNF